MKKGSYLSFSIVFLILNVLYSQSCPVANAGSDQLVPPNVLVTLDGSASYDPDGIIYAYEWQQTNGTFVNLEDENSEIATFNTPSALGDLTFRLTIYDDDFKQGISYKYSKEGVIISIIKYENDFIVEQEENLILLILSSSGNFLNNFTTFVAALNPYKTTR